MKYVIGIEGGGTKSRAAALSLDRKELGRARGTGMNLQNTPEERLKETLTHLVKQFRSRLGRPAAESTLLNMKPFHFSFRIYIYIHELKAIT